MSAALGARSQSSLAPVNPVDMDYNIPDMLRPNERMHTFVNPLNDANQHSRRQYIHGQVLWDPLKLIGHWDNRATAFLSFAFALGTLSTNVPELAKCWERHDRAVAVLYQHLVWAGHL
jgi:hypothetical protein